MQEILNRAPRLTLLLLVIAMIATTGWQCYRFWVDLQTPTASAVQPQTLVDRSRQPPAIDLANISLFGLRDSNEAAAVADTESLPTTNLRLVLRGVSASGAEESEQQQTSALVEGPDRQTDYYVIGSELPGQAALKAVYADRIVIDRQGNLENLYFPEEFEATSFDAQDAAPAVHRNDSVNPSVQSSSAQSGSGASEARKEEIRARLDRLRERLRSNN